MNARVGQRRRTIGRLEQVGRRVRGLAALEKSQPVAGEEHRVLGRERDAPGEQRQSVQRPALSMRNAMFFT